MTSILPNTNIRLLLAGLALALPLSVAAQDADFIPLFNAALERSTPCAEGGCDRGPRLLQGEWPTYPGGDLVQRKQGRVVLEFEILADGSVADPTVRWSNSAAMRESALRAVRNWRFAPAEREGQAMALKVRQVFRFQLGTGDSRMMAAATAQPSPG